MKKSTGSRAGDKTFRAAYETLKRHADSLRDQDEPNIDELLTIVEESMAAYKVCKARIAAVEEALKKALIDIDEAIEVGIDDDDGETMHSKLQEDGPNTSRGSKAPPGPFDDMDDNIPF